MRALVGGPAPAVQRAAATGTYGGGRSTGKLRGASTKPASKLHLVSHKDESSAPASGDHDDFEEF